MYAQYLYYWILLFPTGIFQPITFSALSIFNMDKCQIFCDCNYADSIVEDFWICPKIL